MDKKTISILGIMLLIGLILTGCAGYYGGYGYYDYPYFGYDDYPYYNYGYGYYGYPYYRGHEWGEHHREMGVAPRFEEHRGPASGQTGHSEPMNKTPTPRMPAHGNQHEDGR